MSPIHNGISKYISVWKVYCTLMNTKQEIAQKLLRNDNFSSTFEYHNTEIIVSIDTSDIVPNYTLQIPQYEYLIDTSVRNRIIDRLEVIFQSIEYMSTTQSDEFIEYSNGWELENSSGDKIVYSNYDNSYSVVLSEKTVTTNFPKVTEVENSTDSGAKFQLYVYLNWLDPIELQIYEAVEDYLYNELQKIDQIGEKRASDLADNFKSATEIEPILGKATYHNMSNIKLRHKLQNHFADIENPIQNVIKEQKHHMIENGETEVIAREI